MARKRIAVLLLTGMLAGFAAFAPVQQASAHSGGQGIVQGEVTQKFTNTNRDDNNTIAVDGEPYQVPLGIYDRVDVGSVVRFDGTRWTIVSGGI